MSAQDASFLHIEDANSPMHIGSVTVFEGPSPSYGDLVRMIASKLPLLPRYRQRVRFVPLTLGRPVWVDDPHFQILYHVRHTALPRPGGAEQLRNLAGRVLAQLLDRGKPLWEIWLVDGVAEGRWALVSKVHHCMVDGVSGTDLLTVLLDASPEQEPVPSPPWEPAPEPSAARLVADALVDSVAAPLERLRALPAVARVPVLTGIPAREALRLVVSLGQLRSPTASSLNGPIGPHRRWSWAEASLDDVKVVRNVFPATVNDVVLATITRGFRDLLLARGESVEGRVVRTLVPVSVRNDNERGVYNNRVSAMIPGLPVGVEDPMERLELIHEQMDELKRSGQAVAGDVLTRLSGFAPPMLLSVGTRLAMRYPQRLFQTGATNVPGPRVPLYALGRRLLFSYPYAPIMSNVRIVVAIFSYAGGLFYGITADYDSVPDIDVLREGIEQGMIELVAAARMAGPPNGVAPRRAERNLAR